MISEQLRQLHRDILGKIDAETIVRQAGGRALLEAPSSSVLAVGKAALPMARGLLDGWPPSEPARGAASDVLVVTTRRLAAGVAASPGARLLAADHPQPTELSAAGARAAIQLVASVPEDGRLVVLLSGGSSSLLCGPAPGLSLEDKRDCITALSRAGVAIRELNIVRKHLSSIKGGRLGAMTRAQTDVLLLSDVIGDDPSIIGSGPFTCDPSTYREALDIVQAAIPWFGGPALAHLQAGVAGQRAETPKAGDPSLAHVRTRVLAGPWLVREEATRLAATSGWRVELGDIDTAAAVPDLASRIVQRAASAAPPWPLMVIGNGEPTMSVTGDGLGGRATHLALLVARGLSALPAERRARVAFLAAGTDDRDGSADATGAVVDGWTWLRALDAGAAPDNSLARCDSYRLLDSLGATVRGTGTSNLLDMHLLAISG